MDNSNTEFKIPVPWGHLAATSNEKNGENHSEISINDNINNHQEQNEDGNLNVEIDESIMKLIESLKANVIPTNRNLKPVIQENTQHDITDLFQSESSSDQPELTQPREKVYNHTTTKSEMLEVLQLSEQNSMSNMSNESSTSEHVGDGSNNMSTNQSLEPIDPQTVQNLKIKHARFLGKKIQRKNLLKHVLIKSMSKGVKTVISNGNRVAQSNQDSRVIQETIGRIETHNNPETVIKNSEPVIEVTTRETNEHNFQGNRIEFLQHLEKKVNEMIQEEFQIVEMNNRIKETNNCLQKEVNEITQERNVIHLDENIKKSNNDMPRPEVNLEQLNMENQKQNKEAKTITRNGGDIENNVMIKPSVTETINEEPKCDMNKNKKQSDVIQEDTMLRNKNETQNSQVTVYTIDSISNTRCNSNDHLDVEQDCVDNSERGDVTTMPKNVNEQHPTNKKTKAAKQIKTAISNEKIRNETFSTVPSQDNIVNDTNSEGSEHLEAKNKNKTKKTIIHNSNMEKSVLKSSKTIVNIQNSDSGKQGDKLQQSKTVKQKSMHLNVNIDQTIKRIKVETTDEPRDKSPSEVTCDFLRTYGMIKIKGPKKITARPGKFNLVQQILLNIENEKYAKSSTPKENPGKNCKDCGVKLKSEAMYLMHRKKCLAAKSTLEEILKKIKVPKSLQTSPEKDEINETTSDAPENVIVNEKQKFESNNNYSEPSTRSVVTQDINESSYDLTQNPNDKNSIEEDRQKVIAILTSNVPEIIVTSASHNSNFNNTSESSEENSNKNKRNVEAIQRNSNNDEHLGDRIEDRGSSSSFPKSGTKSPYRSLYNLYEGLNQEHIDIILNAPRSKRSLRKRSLEDTKEKQTVPSPSPPASSEIIITTRITANSIERDTCIRSAQKSSSNNEASENCEDDGNQTETNTVDEAQINSQVLYQTLKSTVQNEILNQSTHSVESSEENLDPMTSLISHPEFISDCPQVLPKSPRIKKLLKTKNVLNPFVMKGPILRDLKPDTKKKRLKIDKRKNPIRMSKLKSKTNDLKLIELLKTAQTLNKEKKSTLKKSKSLMLKKNDKIKLVNVLDSLPKRNIRNPLKRNLKIDWEIEETNVQSEISNHITRNTRSGSKVRKMSEDPSDQENSSPSSVFTEPIGEQDCTEEMETAEEKNILSENNKFIPYVISSIKTQSNNTSLESSENYKNNQSCVVTENLSEIDQSEKQRNFLGLSDFIENMKKNLNTPSSSPLTMSPISTSSKSYEFPPSQASTPQTIEASPSTNSLILSNSSLSNPIANNSIRGTPTTSKYRTPEQQRMRTELLEEIRKLEKKQWCDLCKKSFANTSTLKIHISSKAHKKQVENSLFQNNSKEKGSEKFKGALFKKKEITVKSFPPKFERRTTRDNKDNTIVTKTSTSGNENSFFETTEIEIIPGESSCDKPNETSLSVYDEMDFGPEESDTENNTPTKRKRRKKVKSNITSKSLPKKEEISPELTNTLEILNKNSDQLNENEKKNISLKSENSLNEIKEENCSKSKRLPRKCANNNNDMKVSHYCRICKVGFPSKTYLNKHYATNMHRTAAAILVKEMEAKGFVNPTFDFISLT